MTMENQERVSYESIPMQDFQDDRTSHIDNDDSQHDESDSDITEINEQKYDCYEKIRLILKKISQRRSNELQKKQIEEMKRSSSFRKILEGYALPNIIDEGIPNYYINMQTFLLEKCKNDIFVEDGKEQIFFAAALLQQTEVDTILESLEGHSKLDYVRDAKTIIHFVLKYGNLGNHGIVQCVKKLIDPELEVDLNVCDFDGCTVLEHVTRLYDIYSKKENATETDGIKTKNLKAIAQALIDSNRCYIDEQTRTKMTEFINVQAETFSIAAGDVNKKTQIFNMVMKKDHKGIKKISLENADVINSNNGEDTLLQLACKKNNLDLVKNLLERGADPNRTCDVNPETPLELCALRNYKELFKEILSKTSEVTPEQFHSFVRKRGTMKTYYFNHLLESKKLNVDYKFETNHNTPLHYAIYFAQSDAIQNLLKRGASLFDKNSSGDAPLQIIDYNDLQRYFDSCMILDKHNSTSSSDPNYKMQFDFSCFFAINNIESSRECYRDVDEWKVIYQIGEIERLQNLLKHPLIYTFLSMKWLEAKSYFYLIFALQTFIYFPLLIMFFFFGDKPSFTLLLFTFLGTLCNVVKIFTVLINHNQQVSSETKSNHCKCLSFSTILENFSTNIKYCFRHATLHCTLECLVTIEMIIVCVLHFMLPRHNPRIAYSAEIRAFVFVGIVLIVLLTSGYHPTLSKWSVMLRKIYKTFSVLIVVLSFPIIAFAMGFHTLWTRTSLNQNEVESSNGSFMTLSSSIFKTYIMSTGDLSLDYDQLGGFVIYCYYILFAISMAIIIMNFFLAIACRDMDDMEKNSELNSIKNIVIFLYFVDSFYCVCSTLSVSNVLKFFKISEFNLFRTPFMLSKMNRKKKTAGRFDKIEEFKIDFFINKPKPFSFSNSRMESEKRKIDGRCLVKIKKYINDKNTKIKKEKERQDELRQLLRELNSPVNLRKKKSRPQTNCNRNISFAIKSP